MQAVQEVATTVRIPLRNRHGEVVAEALIDAADVWVTEHRWCLNRGYVVRNTSIPGGRTVKFSLAREIMGLVQGGGDGLQVDHISRDPLDNRRANLRVCTGAQNCQNLGPGKGSSAYRGVAWVPRLNRWRADVRFGGRQRHLGYFDREEDAAAAAASFRAEHMPFSEEAAA